MQPGAEGVRPQDTAAEPHREDRPEGAAREQSDSAGPPLLAPDAFAKLTKKKMWAELKALGLGKGKSRARKKELSELYRAWYEDSTREPQPAREPDAAPAETEEPPSTEAPVADEPPAAEEAPAEREGSEEPSAEAPAEEEASVEREAPEEPAEEEPRQEPEVAPPWEARSAREEAPAGREAPEEPAEPPAEEEPPAEGEAPEEPSVEPPAQQEAPEEPVGEPPAEDEPPGEPSVAPPTEEQEEPRAAAEPAEEDDFDLDIAPAGSERRQSERVHLEVDIGFRTETNFYVGFSTDISEGGLFVATVYLLPVGCPVDLTFVLPGGHAVEAQGTVRWVREPRAFDSRMTPGIGIGFDRIAPEHADAIQTYMRLRDPLFYVD